MTEWMNHFSFTKMVRDYRKKKHEVPCVKKELEKAFLSQTRIEHFKNKSSSYCWIFFSSQTDLIIFMLTDPTSPSKDSFNYRVGELIEQNDDIGEFFIVPNLLEKNGIWNTTPHLKNGDKYYRRAFIFSVPSTENSGTALETFLQNICNGILVKVIFKKFFINLLSSMVFCPLNFIYISQICTDEELTKWQYTKKYAPLYKMNL